MYHQITVHPNTNPTGYPNPGEDEKEQSDSFIVCLYKESKTNNSVPLHFVHAFLLKEMVILSKCKKIDI